MRSSRFAFFSLRSRFKSCSLDSARVAACCGRNPALLRALLAENSSPLERVMLHWENTPECLMGTLLCLAAAAGRTDQVRELLERGMDPNEHDAPSARYSCPSRMSLTQS